MNGSSVRILSPLVILLIGFAFSEGRHAHGVAAADVGNQGETGPGAIDFFCPELVFYQQQLKTAGLTNAGEDLKEYLGSVTKQARAATDGKTTDGLGTNQARLLRAVLYVIAAEEVSGLAAPILEVLRTIDDPLVQTAAEQALAATVGKGEIGQVKQGIATREAERVRASCIRVSGRLRIAELESQLVELLGGEHSADLELVTAIALAECGQPVALDSLLSLLASPRSAIRYRAAVILRQWTKQDFGYSTHRKVRDRAYAIQRWRRWFSSVDKSTMKPLQLQRHPNVLAVRGKELFELGPDGQIIHEQDGFNSLSEAIGLEGGHRLVTDFMGRAQFEYDEDWKEVKCHRVPFQPRGSHRLKNGLTLVIGMHRFQLFDSIGAAAAGPVTFPGRTNFTGSILIGRKRFLVTCNDTGMILEMDFSGEVLWELKAENHPRSVQVLDDGRLLVADFRQAVIYSSDGDAEWRYALEGVRSAHQLPSGNILLGHPSGLSVIDPSGTVLWEMKQPPRGGSGFFAQLEAKTNI